MKKKKKRSLKVKVVIQIIDLTGIAIETVGNFMTERLAEFCYQLAGDIEQKTNQPD